MSRLTRSQKKGKNSSYTCRFLKKRLYLTNYPANFLELDLKIQSFLTMPKSNAILMKVKGKDNFCGYYPAPEGVRVGSNFNDLKEGSVVVKPLKDYEEGDIICNVERKKFMKGFMFSAAGVSGKIVLKRDDLISVQRQGRIIKLKPEYLAMKGQISNSGAQLKPIGKAGVAFIINKKKGKKYPIVSAHKMNAQDHPSGGSYRKSRGRPMTCSRHCPPGRKYGSIAAKRTGKKKK